MTLEIARLENLPADTKLVDAAPVASLAVTAEVLGRRAGIDWQDSVEQLGQAQTAIVAIPSGARFGLMTYADAPEPHVTVYGGEPARGLDELLALLAIEDGEVVDRVDRSLPVKRPEDFRVYTAMLKRTMSTHWNLSPVWVVYATQAVARRAAEDPAAALTARQSEILTMVASGSTAAEIAARLDIRRDSVVRHLREAVERFIDNDPDLAAQTFRSVWQHLEIGA